jgi:hypothetical protein
VKAILAREEELRKNEDAQIRFEEAESSGDRDWIVVAEEIQAETLQEFGIEPTPFALHQLRLAAARIGTSFYIKFNRARQGNLSPGSPAPDVPLVSFTTEAPATLLSYAKPGRPLVVLAGSFS